MTYKTPANGENINVVVYEYRHQTSHLIFPMIRIEDKIKNKLQTVLDDF